MEKKTHLYKVVMTCDGCSGAVRRVLEKSKDSGIENVDISLEDQSVKVLTTMPSEKVLELIKKTGKSAEYISSS